MSKSKAKPQLPPRPMPTGTFTITVNKFRPIGGAFPTSAHMTPDKDNPPCITIQGENITVKGKNPVQLIFKLPIPQLQPPVPGFVLIGIAFAANSPVVTVGMHTFPNVNIDRKPDSSTMTVTDQPQNLGTPQRYDYIIIVQSIASGEIGIIDPDIDNQP